MEIRTILLAIFPSLAADLYAGIPEVPMFSTKNKMRMICK